MAVNIVICLGDGVYASFDDDCIWLRKSINKIALKPQVLEALELWIDDLVTLQKQLEKLQAQYPVAENIRAQSRSSQKKYDTYLGDGVYVSYDGFYIWLDLRDQSDSIRIALDPGVLAALDAFREQINLEAADDSKTANR